MAWDLLAATEYITLNTLDNEDFIGADDTRKTAVLNVADRTLRNMYADYVIPAEASYLFGAVLASAYNDTNKMAQQGVASFSVKGLSFSFKDGAKSDLSKLVPQEALDLIGAENGGIKLSIRQAKWTVI